MRLQRGRVLADRREVPRLGRGFVAPFAQFRSDCVGDRANVSAAAQFGDEAPAGSERGRDRVEDGVLVVDPVQHRVREHGVDRVRDLEVAGVAPPERQFGVRLAGRLDHLRGLVDPDDVRASVGDAVGQVAGAAAEVENPLARLGIEEVEDVCAVLVDERV